MVLTISSIKNITILFKVPNLFATQSPSPNQPILSCRRQPPCKPGDSKLFDIRGQNINLLTTGNSAKVRSYQHPKAQRQARGPVS